MAPTNFNGIIISITSGKDYDKHDFLRHQGSELPYTTIPTVTPSAQKYLRWQARRQYSTCKKNPCLNSISEKFNYLTIAL